MTIAKPPLIQEIERVHALYWSEVLRAKPDFRKAGELRMRKRELVAWARVNGWSTMPDGDRPPPTASATTAKSA